MKPRIYIDTSVIGGCHDDEFSEWSDALFDEIRSGLKMAVVSDLTRLELEEAPKNVVDVLSSIPKEQVEDVFLGREVIHEKEV